MSRPLWSSLPPGWLTGQVKHAATVTLGKMLQSKDSGGDTLVPYMRAANVQPDGVLALDDASEMWFGARELAQLNLKRGDVVVVEGGQGGFGRAAFLPADLHGWGFQNSINRLRALEPNDGRFLAYYLIALRASGFVHAYCNSVSMPHLTAEKLARLPVPLPPGAEQRAIADYLDHETAQIDILIAKQEQLIATLRERRSSLVDQVLLQDDIERVPLRRVADVIDCAHVTATFVDDDRSYPVASIRECQGKVVDLSSCRHTTKDFYDLLRAGGREPRIGDLLFVRNVSVGLVSIVAPGTRDFAVGQETVLLRRTGEINPDYLRYALTTSVVRYEIEGRMIGSTFRRINVPAIRTLPIPLPPPAEQRRAVEHLDEQISKIDVLIAKAEGFIELSKERRTALITAAVTGQIDVRASA